MTDRLSKGANEIEAYFERMELLTAPAWRPEVDESIFGEVVGLRMGDGDYGPYPIIVVRADYGTRSIHAFHTLLRDGFKEIGVKKGMRVAITYKGVVTKNSAADKDVKDIEKTDTYHMFFVADLDKVQEDPEVAFEL